MNDEDCAPPHLMEIVDDDGCTLDPDTDGDGYPMVRIWLRPRYRKCGL